MTAVTVKKKKHAWKESTDKKRPPFIICTSCGFVWKPGMGVPKHPCDD